MNTRSLASAHRKQELEGQTVVVIGGSARIGLETARRVNEAQGLKGDAAKRLSEVEKRWAKLDVEIAAMKALAELETNREMQVLRKKTEEDVRRIMEYSQSEVDRMAQGARHQLKAFAARLAVSLARESIQIDKKTDEELVKDFIEGLGDKQICPNDCVASSARQSRTCSENVRDYKVLQCYEYIKVWHAVFAATVHSGRLWDI